LLLFDFDGVIYNSLEAYENSLIQVLAQMGKPLITDRAGYLDLFDDNLFSSLTAKGIDLAEFFLASQANRHLVCHEQLEPYPGVIEVLKKLHARHRLFVVSSNRAPVIEMVATRYGFRDCLENILGADTSLSKIAKIELITKAGDEQGKSAFFVTDTTGDIREAQSAGIKTVAVTWGWHDRSRLAGVGPDHIVDHPEELLALWSHENS
jgi:phosphoglycolate phosphatase